MTKERIFPLKIDANGHGALKEQVHKHINGDQTRIKVLFGLDAELRTIEPCLLIDGAFVSSSVVASQRGMSLQDFLHECKLENKTLYFPFGNLTYICVQNVVKDRGEVTKNFVNVFLPSEAAKTGLLCNDVSTIFPHQSRNALAGNYLTYSLSRV